jgi:hypothetical protein
LQLLRWEARTPYDRIIEDVRKICAPLHKPTLAIDITAVRMTVAALFRKAKLNARLVPISVVQKGELAPLEDGSWAVPKLDLVSLMAVLTGGRRPGGGVPLLAVASELGFAAELQDELQRFSAKVSLGSNPEDDLWRASEGEDLVLAVAVGCLAGERLSLRFSVGC